MRPNALYWAPITLAFGRLFCGVAALRDVDDEGELTMTESPRPDSDPVPPSCGHVRNAFMGRDDGQEGSNPVCSCAPGFEAVDGYGVLCFDELSPAWPPDTVPRRECSCEESTCVDRVYAAIFLQPLDFEQVEFPNALPGLIEEDLTCLVSEPGIASASMGPQMVPGITEKEVWTADEEGQAVVAFKDILFDDNTAIWAVGDIHGRLGTLRRINAAWHGGGMTPYIVGLGDMIDRGNRQLEVIAGMIAWRAKYPHKVSIVRGNHETQAIAAEYGFKCVDASPGMSPYQGGRLYDPFTRFFEKFPAAIRIKQPNPKANAIFMHGGFGPSTLKFLISEAEHALSVKTTVSFDVVEELLWSERGEECKSGGEERQTCDNVRGGRKPPNPDDMFEPSKYRGYGNYRSHAATRSFMALTESCLIITGHSHRSIFQRISPDEADPPTSCSAIHGESGPDTLGYTQALILSAHGFYRKQDQSFKHSDNNGKLGILAFGDGGTVRFSLRHVFRDGSYDDVSQRLDVGVHGGHYPNDKEGCGYLELRDGGYQCHGSGCPQDATFRKKG